MSDFHQKHKHHFFLWITLLLLTAVSGYFAFFSPQHQSESQSLSSSTIANVNQAPIPSSATTAAIPAPAKSPEPKPAEFVYNSVDKSTIYDQQSTTTPALQQNLIFATFTVGDKTYETNVPADSTAYTAMQQLAKTTAFTYAGKSYGGLGFFVEEINGVKNNPAEKMYWFYYVNGARGTVGVSTYIVKANDNIEWKYEKSDN